jgi:hypothetical protein
MAFGFPHISFIGYPAPVPCPGHAGLGFREARAGDEPAILAHFERLSPADRYRRFCAAVSDGRLAAHVEGLFQRNSFTIVGLDGPLFDGPFHRAGVVRAVIEVVVFDGVAEFGLSVDGDRRRAGVATCLVLTAARLLALRRIDRMVAMTQPNNHAMFGLGRSLGAAIDIIADDTLLVFPVALAGPGHVVADAGTQPLEPVGAQGEPQLQRAEAAAERHGPFVEVGDRRPGPASPGSRAAGRACAPAGPDRPGTGPRSRIARRATCAG